MLNSSWQHTISSPCTIKGIGVHSGTAAVMTLNPARAGHGITFVRTDMTDQDNVIPARWDLVTNTQLCTVLSNASGVTISTVEHILSACAALGIDNLRIDVSGPEIPIMDGSAMRFVEAIDHVGRRPQNAPRKILHVKKTISYQEGDKEVFLSPAQGSFYGGELVYESPAIGQQKYIHALKEKIYRREIAEARSFGFLKDLEQLRVMGLAKGSSLENAVGIDHDHKIMNPEGLRYPNEPVRHKILDAIGDLYLCGMQILGHYHGFKAGHAMNNKLLHVLFSQKDAFEIIEAESTAPVPLSHTDTRATVSVVA